MCIVQNEHHCAVFNAHDSNIELSQCFTKIVCDLKIEILFPLFRSTFKARFKQIF